MDVGSAPRAPDPRATAAAQAEANRVNYFTPTGDLRYGTTGPGGQFIPGSGNAALQVVETPGAAAYRQATEGTAQNLANLAQRMSGNLPTSPLTYEGLPDYQSQIDYSRVDPIMSGRDFAEDRARVEQGIFDRGMTLLNPVFEDQNRALQNRLKYVPMGAEARGTAEDRAAQAQQNAINDLTMRALEVGGGEQSRLLGEARALRGEQIGQQLQDMNLSNMARQTGFGEQAAVRQNTLNELAQLLGGPQIQTATFGGPAPIDVTGPINTAYSGQLNNYNQQLAARNAALGAGAGLAGAGLAGWSSAGFPGWLS